MAIAGFGQKVQVARAGRPLQPRMTRSGSSKNGWIVRPVGSSILANLMHMSIQVLPFLRLIQSLLGSTADWLFNILEIVMSTGTVKWFNPTKGYGFIQPQGGGQDVFVHISAVERAGLNTLNEGQQIEYEIVSNRGKSSAENLRVR
jgi:cold shock protein